jgi:hypothetical protein
MIAHKIINVSRYPIYPNIKFIEFYVDCFFNFGRIRKKTEKDGSGEYGSSMSMFD